ncbi:MAG: 2-C-methyl-D-erythritol 2,4-cyclodiphosphate synthase [Aquificae bacterium]|nr:2-C-methyl-D-erythritol 2,4-cyclodiphosphate synthase [Aquificota bacterium]
MFRVGVGFDAHRFDPEGKRPLKLGGVVVSTELSLKGHSDADVLLHALTDALLGAAGEPDIGELFPPSDPRWKNADSALFLKEALRRVRKKGFEVINADCVVVCDRPKISPVKGKIVENLARLLGVPTDRVNLKGKTTEGLYSPEGISVICTVLLGTVK